MPKKIRCLLKEIAVVDNGISILLKFDGIENVEETMKWLKARKKIGEEVTILDVLAVIILMKKANRRKEVE